MFKVDVGGEPRMIEGIKYSGYVDGKYGGHVTGFVRSGGEFDILKSHLTPEYRGTKSVRAFRSLIDGVLELHPVIRTRIDNTDNGEIKLVLSAGFRIIGTATHRGITWIELIKHKETK